VRYQLTSSSQKVHYGGTKTYSYSYTNKQPKNNNRIFATKIKFGTKQKALTTVCKLQNLAANGKLSTREVAKDIPNIRVFPENLAGFPYSSFHGR
jgi:hypothetical protein